MEPPKDKDPDKLIDDENFVRLMDSEYQRAGKPVDQLGKSRVWDQIQNNVNQSVVLPKKDGTMKKLQLIGLLAAGIGAVFLSMRYFERPEETGQQIKGVRGGIEFRIGQYLQSQDGELVPRQDLSKRTPGSVIVPYIETLEPAAVLLVKKTGEETFEAVSDAEMTSGGEEHYFGRNGETAAILIEKTPETYCVVVTDSMPAMGHIVSALPVIGSPSDLIRECFSL